MDDLDQQLAHLQLMNTRDLSPMPPGLVKKVGPAVPPKPKKPTPTGHNSVYSNIQLTLDNPAILEQKLEALEHHKRVLENQRRAKLNASGPHHSSSSHSAEAPPPPEPPLATHPDYARSFRHSGGGASNGLAASSAVTPSNGSNKFNETIYENQQQLYENVNRGNNDYPGESDDDQPQQHSNYANYRNVAPVVDADGRQMAVGREPSSLIYGNVKAIGNNIGGGMSLRGVMQPSQAELVNPYSNYSYSDRISQDDFPPPPLEIPAPLNLLNNDYQPNEDDLPPPPSPVSSSYSELRRATDNTYPAMPNYSLSNSSQNNYQHLNNMQHMAGGGGGGHHAVGGNHHNLNGDMHQTYANNYATDYGTYAPSLQGSSTYESIYEPINPRPPSQMSSRSNYSLYNPYVSGPQGAGGVGTISGGGPQGSNGKKPSHKETEVDILTDLLVQSMDGSQDSDSYGTCVQCGERVVGESSGCTAMEQIYHIACFTCCQCQINLQGKPFYALDGKPCCEEDYLNTLEKCSVCMTPILERILRATGKPYHPGCFCCVVCKKSLDGVPFTVDATNQNHCIEDFHKKFAPRCCVCRQPILPEPGKEETVRVVALDRSFHVACYKCEDCGLLLSSEAEGRGCFPLDDHILCKSCNAKRVQTLTSHMSTEL